MIADICGELDIGELYVEGDIACEQGDLVMLSTVAEHLLEHVAEPLHCRLAPLVRACTDPRRAANAWKTFKERLQAPRS